MTELFQLGKFLGVLFLFAGFLVSIEVFREIRVPFTSIRLGRTRREPAGADALAAASETAGDRADRRSTRRADRPRRARDGRRPYHGAHAVAPSDAAPSAPPPSAGLGGSDRPGAASLFGTLGPLSRFAYDAGMEPRRVRRLARRPSG